MIQILENLKTITNDEVYKRLEGISLSSKIEGLVLDTRRINLNDYPDLKVISRNGVGLDNINLEECKRRNIIVKITDCSELSYAVAEHALYLTLNLLKNKNEMIRDKIIGIIGHGRIGFTFNKIVRSMLWEYPLIYDNLSCEPIIFKDKLLKNSDVIVVCVSGNQEVLGKKELDMMKQGSYIVNVARDRCVNDDVIVSAVLNEYKIIGYASDVNEKRESKQLYKKYNIIYTPHIASLPAKRFMEEQCIDNLIEGLKEWKK